MTQMKNLKSLLSLAFVVSMVWACGPKGDTVETSDAKAVTTSAEATSVAVNTSNSMVTWIGSKPAGKQMALLVSLVVKYSLKTIR